MAANYKVLGQAAPAADATVDLYTAPAQAITSTLVVCNRSTSQLLYRVAVRPAGAALANQHYLVYDNVIDPSDSAFLTVGLTLAATDVVTVKGGTLAGLTFSLFGTEVS